MTNSPIKAIPAIKLTGVKNISLRWAFLGFCNPLLKNNFTRKVIAGNGNPAQEPGSNKSCLRSVISFPDPTTHLIYTLEGMCKNSGNAR